MKTQRFLDDALDSINGLEHEEYDCARNALINLYDSMNECIEEVESDNYDKENTIKDRDNEISELESQLEDAEHEISQLQDELLGQ